MTYTLTAAGPVTIEAILPGVPGMRMFRAACVPNMMSLAHSALGSPPGGTVAGEPCTLTIKQHDRYSTHPCSHLLMVQLCSSFGHAASFCWC